VSKLPDPDNHLIQSLQKREQGAFTSLYDLYGALIFGIISRIIEDETEAENLLQDSFLKIWQNIDRYDSSKGRLATWLINIARNTAIDFRRSKYFNQKLKNQNIENLVGFDKGHPVIHPLIETLGLRELVNKLNPVCREVIELMYFDGLTQQEISDTFNIPLGTVKSRTRLALKELKAFYEH